MTNHDEKRVIWILVFCVGVVLAMPPVLLPAERYALFDFRAACSWPRPSHDYGC